jgi:pimeloyl-ACP methyl ester carboxylesterase
MVIFNDPVPVENPALQAVLMERYDTLAAPIVVITGDRDTVVSPGHHAMRLAAAVPGARVEVLPGFGHMLHHAAVDRIIATPTSLR